MDKKLLMIITVIVIFLVGIALFFSINNFSKEDIQKNDINEEFVKFVSDEFNFSLGCPTNWWHNNVPAENLGNDPLSSVILLSLDLFGYGEKIKYSQPFFKNDTHWGFSVSVYNVAKGYTIEDAKTELGLYDARNVSEIINNYNAIVKIRDDSNHEIESVRMFVKDYYIQDKNNFYKISFVGLNKSVLDKNSAVINNILNSFQIIK